ncbi:hypothetical protein ACS0TY_000721 [Phlomoides rotata]
MLLFGISSTGSQTSTRRLSLQGLSSKKSQRNINLEASKLQNIATHKIREILRLVMS